MIVREIKIKQIDDIDDQTVGIYSWHLKPRKLDENKIKKIYEVFSKFEINLFGNVVLNNFTKFGDSFHGELNRKLDNEELYEKAKQVDIDFIIEFLKQNALPLYIGRSKNVKNRLHQHYKSYLNSVSLNFLTSQLVKFEDDTDEESGYFGIRLANLNYERWFNENELFIKYYTKEQLNYDQIKDIEYLLNRLYKPILGMI